MASQQQEKFIQMYAEKLVPQTYRDLATKAKNQGELLANSQKTAQVLFERLKRTKAKDNQSGEEIPLISTTQAKQIKNKLETRKQ